MKETTFNTIKDITKFDFPCISQFDLDLIYETNDIEFLCKVLEKLNEVIDSQNLIVKDFNKIVQFVNEKIEKYTKEQLNKWLEDGTINNIILTLGKIVTFVDTTNELKEKENLIINQLILTSGFYSIDDKCGGLFIVSDTPKGFYIKNKDFYINLINNKTTIQLEKTGIKENSDISDILNIVANYYNVVIFPQGNFFINSTININNKNIELKGNNTVLETTNSIGYLFKTYKTNFKCNNIQFLGNAGIETNDENGLVAINCLNSDNSVIENCIFSKFNKNIEITNSTNILINNCSINKSYETLNKINGYGVLFENVTNGSITNCNMDEIERHCIYINECNNIEINNNNLIGQKNNYQRFSNYEGNIKVNGSKNINIYSNVLDGNYYSISLLKSFNSDFGCSYINIYDNICKNIIKGYSFIRGFIGIIENGNYSDIKIHDNIIYNDTKNINTRGIVLDYGTLSNIEIYNNNIKNVGYGIRINRTSPIYVNNNNVLNSQLAYDFSTNDLQIFGNYNYYGNCEKSCNGNLIHLKKCNLKGFIDLNNAFGVVTEIINSNDNNIFVGTNTPVTINNITGGATSQELTIVSDYENGASLIKTKLPSYIKINSDFNKGIIRLKKINTTWYEISRTV